MSRAVRRVVRGVTRTFDTVTGDILDLDQSKQKEQLEAMRKAEEEAIQREEAKKQAERDYQKQVADAKDKLNTTDGLMEDDTGVGLSDVKIDFTKNLTKKDDEDSLKKVLRNY